MFYLKQQNFSLSPRYLRDFLLFIFFLNALINKLVIMSTQAKFAKKKNWTDEEELFIKLKRQIDGVTSWKIIAKSINEQFPMKTRTGKQCRERYINFVRHDRESALNDSWTCLDDQSLLDRFEIYGPQWTTISNIMKKKSQNFLKNRFNGIFRKLSRRITKQEKIMKMKLKKPIKCATLIDILKKAQRCGDNYDISKVSSQQVSLARRIKFSIISCAIKSQKQQLIQQQIIQLIKQIHDYHLLMRQINFKSKQITQPLCKQNSVSEVNQNDAEQLIVSINKQVKTQIDNKFQLQDRKKQVNQLKQQMSYFFDANINFDNIQTPIYLEKPYYLSNQFRGRDIFSEYQFYL